MVGKEMATTKTVTEASAAGYEGIHVKVRLTRATHNTGNATNQRDQTPAMQFQSDSVRVTTGVDTQRQEQEPLVFEGRLRVSV
jgi:hypothetical protein